MGFELTTADFIEWLKRAHAKIHADSERITALDTAIGGDHWANVNMGLEKLVGMADELAAMSLHDALKRVGMTMMSTGGSGGVLYGSAYMQAATVLKDNEVLRNEDVCNMLEAMLAAIMLRGKAEPGFKTMIDALHPAVVCYKECIEQGTSEAETLALVKKAAREGAESTREMEAARGRASRLSDKGVGHPDPGAVTMSYQIETLMDFISGKL